MKNIILFLMLTITIFPMEKYLYQQDRKDYPKDFYINKEIQENFVYYKFTDGIFTEIFHLDKITGETIFWHYIDNKKNIDIKSIKVMDTIEIKGIFEGKEIDKKEKLDSFTWRQIFPMGLEEEMKNKKKYTFKALAPDGPRALDISKMSIKREKKEILDIDGRTYDTIKVKVSLPNLLSLFWTGDYWYVEDNTLILKGVEPQRKLIFVKKID